MTGPKGPENSVSGTIRAALGEDTGAFHNLDSISQVGELGDSSGAAGAKSTILVEVRFNGENRN